MYTYKYIYINLTERNFEFSMTMINFLYFLCRTSSRAHISSQPAATFFLFTAANCKSSNKKKNPKLLILPFPPFTQRPAAAVCFRLPETQTRNSRLDLISPGGDRQGNARGQRCALVTPPWPPLRVQLVPACGPISRRRGKGRL